MVESEQRCIPWADGRNADVRGLKLDEEREKLESSRERRQLVGVAE